MSMPRVLEKNVNENERIRCLLDFGATIRVGRGLEVPELMDSRKSMCHNINAIADKLFPRPISWLQWFNLERRRTEDGNIHQQEPLHG